MSDGQEKSDDLIAELAKLMASSAQGAEGEAKPAPKLVSLDPAPAPATAPVVASPPISIRIPGMDAPVAPAATPNIPPAVPASPPPVLRIPGMDQPVPASRPVEAKPAASFDFGTLPPATSLKPEPLSNWQDREIPKPVPVRPSAPVAATPPEAAPVAVTAPALVIEHTPEPQVTRLPVAAEPRPMPDLRGSFSPTPPFEASRPEPVAAPARPASPTPPAIDFEPIVAATRPAPEGDSFNFDFGFGNAAPEPVSAPRPAAATARPTPAASVSGDPIADLIAAELDAGGERDIGGAPQPVGAPAAAPRPAMPQPAPRNFAMPAANPGAPQRPVVNIQPRPVAQPAPRAETPSAAPRQPERAAQPSFTPVARPAPVAAAPVAPVERDPMDEIESLIGEAVRVELSAPERTAPQLQVQVPAQPQAAPVVPPLTTGFAPRRAAIKETEAQVPSAEAAILAAAAASGAEIGRLEGNLAAGPSPYKRPKAKPERRTFLSGGMRQYVGMAVAGTLLLAAGFGLYWVLGMGRGGDAEAPVLSADATPVKETPPATTATTENPQGSVVFNEMDGVADDTNEQLVSRDDSADTSVADVARTVGEDNADAGSESELANRKVRTVTVRPDGTIVSGDDAVAGTEALPVDRPNVPDLPGADVQPSDLLAAVPSNDNPAVSAATDASATPAVSASLDVPVNPDAVIDSSIVAPVPMARPVDRSRLGGGSNQPAAAVADTGPVDLVNAPAADSAQVTSGGGAYVQLSSQRSEGDAQASLRTTRNRLGNVLNGSALEIRRVDLGAKGVWYRVVLPTDSFQSATQTCASIKANGGDCVPING